MPYWLDGNNLIGQTARQARDDRQTRNAFLKLLGSYAAQRGGQFIVFFDGDDPGHSIASPGVHVRYSAPLSADDALLQRLCGLRHPDEVIVVTNDRGLTRRCRDAGAQTLKWSDFGSVMRKSRPRQDRREKEDQVNVSDWARYFGLDDDSLE
jgi:predicted RNA-binding protein with PIN domain